MKQGFEFSTYRQVKRERYELFVCLFVRCLGTGTVAGVQNLQSCDYYSPSLQPLGIEFISSNELKGLLYLFISQLK